MSRLRTAVSVLVVIALAAGYGASQWAYFHGNPTEYAAAVDTPLVKALALIVLLLASASLFLPEKEGEAS